MPRLHWILRSFLLSIVVAVVLVVGGTIAMRYGMGSTTAAVGGVMFLAGLPVAALVLLVSLVRGWRRSRRQHARAHVAGRAPARPGARPPPHAPARPRR